MAASYKEKLQKLRTEHYCQLPTQEDIIVRYIDSGWFVHLRRTIKQHLVVNPNHPSSKAFLKSSAAIRIEKARHLQHYYYMIHPFSSARTYWEFFMMFVLLLLLILIPMELSIEDSGWILGTPKFILNLICLADICITFATGYYHPNTKKIILDRKMVAKRYLMNFFVIDLVSSFPLAFIVFAAGLVEHWQQFMNLIAYLKFLRIMTLMRYLDSFRDWKEYSIYKFKFFKIMLVFLIMILWATSITYMVALPRTTTWLPESVRGNVLGGLLFSLFRCCYMFYGIGYGSRPSEHLVDLVIHIVGLQISVILRLYLLAQVVQILHKYDISGNKYQQLIKQLNEYVRYKELPVSMKHRIRRYFDFRFQKHYYKESEILGIISPQLRQEITLHTCRSFVEEVDFFKDLPLSLILTIVQSLKVVIFLPNDVIVHAGVPGESMYFISYGTVAVYSMSGKEVCHLSDGSHFGEIALVIENEKRIASVVAVDECELFDLHRHDFQKAMEPYPQCYMRMKREALERLERTKSFVDSERPAPSSSDQLFQD